VKFEIERQSILSEFTNKADSPRATFYDVQWIQAIGTINGIDADLTCIFCIKSTRHEALLKLIRTNLLIKRRIVGSGKVSRFRAPEIDHCAT